MTINVDNIESIKVVPFRKSKWYYIVIKPTDTYTDFSFRKWKFVEKKHGAYTFGEYGYPGIYHSLDFIKNLGYIIYNDEVGFPPKLVITYKSGRKETYEYDTIEEAEEVRDKIAKQMKNMITI